MEKAELDLARAWSVAAAELLYAASDVREIALSSNYGAARLMNVAERLEGAAARLEAALETRLTRRPKLLRAVGRNPFSH